MSSNLLQNDEKTFTFSELEQIIRDRMYEMPNGRRPNEGCNAVLYKLIDFLKYGEDAPND